MATKSQRAWVIVDKKSPRINLNEIYSDKKGITITKQEMFIRVEIKEVKK